VTVETIPSTGVGWLRRDGNALLLAAGVLYALLYLAFWPTIYSTMDEASYMGNAYVLRQGTLYADAAGIAVPTNYPVGGHYVSKYPLGMAAVVAVMSLAGWKVALGVNLLVHLLTFVVVVKTLRLLRLPGAFALLYLLYPTAVLYSRTVMSDPLSGLLLALAFYQYLRQGYAATGALAGLSVLVRTGNALAVPIFVLAALLDRPASVSEADWRARLRPPLLIVAASLPPLAVAGYYAKVIAGGEMASHTGTFSLHYFPEMFPAYVIALLLVYPGMLLAPALYRGPGRLIVAGLSYAFVLLYSLWFYRDTGSGFADTLIRELRYFLAVMPLMIVAYAEVLWRLLGERRTAGVPLRVGAALVTTGLFAVAAAVSYKHARFLGTMAEVRNGLLAATTPADRIYCNMQVAKLMHPGWGRRQVILVSQPDRERASLRAWLNGQGTAGGRAVLAYWVRTGREDDQREAERVASIGGGFNAAPAKVPLPAELTLRILTPPRVLPATASAAATAPVAVP
jgi:hypothetical protein